MPNENSLDILVKIKTCLIIWAWVVKINTVVNDSVCSFILYRWMPISHCLDQSTVIFMESAIWNKQKAMCRLGLALSPPVVFHQSVNSFQSAWALMSAASLTWLNSVKPYFLNQSVHPFLIGHALFQKWWWKILRDVLNLFWKINSNSKLFWLRSVKVSSCIN